jgi:Ca2+-binding RTX toxin-like protein
MVVTWKGTNGNDTKAAHKTYFGLVWETWKMYGDDGNDNLTGGEDNDYIYGQAGNDNLYGKGDNDYLDGGTGVDWMWGGKGNDTYIVDDTLDRVYESNNEGYDTVKAYSTFVLSSYIEKLELLGQAEDGYGNAQDNTIIGNSLNNRIFGQGGNDTLDGQGGNDSIYGGSGNDAITGGYGSDFLDGGVGADVMNGGLGNDTYVVDNSGDTVTEGYGQGTDTVRSYLTSYTLGNYVENLTLYYSALQGYGNSLDNVLHGNSQNNSLFGYGGEDTLYGHDGNDFLSGGTESDILYGGEGNDRLRGFAPVNDDVRLLEYDELTGGGGADTFVLGDAYIHQYGNFSGVFYLGQDYAHITDFSRAQGDKFEVVGNLSDYTLDDSTNVIGGSGRDTRIFYKGDLIAIAEDVTDLSTGADFIVGEYVIG